MDRIDEQIIEILRSDGRITMSELGRRIAMSSPSTTERVKRLEEEGIIVGYRAVIDEKKVGRPIHAFLLVDSSSETRRWQQRFYQQVRKIEEITGAYYTLTGGLELILEIYCADLERLSEIQQQIFQTFNANTTTYMVKHTNMINALPDQQD